MTITATERPNNVDNRDGYRSFERMDEGRTTSFERCNGCCDDGYALLDGTRADGEQGR